MAIESVGSHAKHRGSTLEGFRGLFVVLFIVFLGLALASMLCAQNWRSLLPGAEGARSMLGGVTNAVYTVISQLS
jgi:light-harvesting complex 1 beta chain